MKSCFDVADLFLSWANRDGDLISNLKMQKLLYYAQAWHLVHFDKPIFDELIEAWEFGPVIPIAYKVFKKFGSGPIEYKTEGAESEKFSKKQIELLETCYDSFIKFSAHELVNMTHFESPWKNAYENNASEIDYKAMKDYYSSLLKNSS